MRDPPLKPRSLPTACDGKENAILDDRLVRNPAPAADTAGTRIEDRFRGRVFLGPHQEREVRTSLGPGSFLSQTNSLPGQSLPRTSLGQEVRTSLGPGSFVVVHAFWRVTAAPGSADATRTA